MDKNFENHIATVLLENENFFALNWQDKEGSNYYRICYFLDKKRELFILVEMLEVVLLAGVDMKLLKRYLAICKM